jgi:hypothetical protein
MKKITLILILKGVNTDGSYRCECSPGFKLDRYGTECEGLTIYRISFGFTFHSFDRLE